MDDSYEKQADRVIRTLKHDSWHGFVDWVINSAKGTEELYRGQRQDWDLLPRIVRTARQRGISDVHSTARDHLEAFRYAIRGRGGIEEFAHQDEDGLWALGQHFGLDTVLLDWTLSPFVALYFALEEADQEPLDRPRCVYQLFHVGAVKNMSVHTDKFKKLVSDLSEAISPIVMDDIRNLQRVLRVVQPLAHANPRLVAQRAVSLTWNLGHTLEQVIKENWKSNDLVMIKHLIPSDDRIKCLHCLDLMNINAGTLFPDIQGAVKYCNFKLANDV
ncbi:MAG: FRG domain-containing protein [Candidatus Zixiibacteriota bacterium]